MPKTITRTELVNAIYNEVGLSRNECSELLQSVLDKMTESLVAGDPVKISKFASFSVRHKKARPGRNPKTGVEVQIPPLKVVVFQPSMTLKERMNHSLS